MRTFLQLKPTLLVGVASLSMMTLTAFAATTGMTTTEPANVESAPAAGYGATKPAAVKEAKPAEITQVTTQTVTPEAPAGQHARVLGDITTIKAEAPSKESTDQTASKTPTSESKAPAAEVKSAETTAKSPTTASPTIEVKQAETPAKTTGNDAATAAPTSVSKADESIGGVAKSVTASSSDASMPANSEAIVGFAKDASLSAFTYDYKNYEGSLKKTSGFFTKEGWAEFQKALAASKNLDTVKKEQLAVNAQLDGPAILQKQEVVAGGGKVWRVDVPIKVSYSGNNNQLSQRLIVHLGIVPVSNEINAAGIAITQFVTLPA